MRTPRTIILTITAALVLAAQTAAADPVELARQADKIVRSAEREMHSGRNTEADALLQQAAALLEQARSEDPSGKAILRVDKNYQRIRGNLDRKLSQSSAAAATASQPAPAAGAASAGGAKLPAGVSKRLQEASGFLNEGEGYAGRDALKAGYKLDQAKARLDEIDRMYAGKFDPTHPDYVAVMQRYQALALQVEQRQASEAAQQADADAAAAQRDAQSAEWVARFQAYLAYPGLEGHDPAQLVYVPGTSEPEKFADAQQRFERFKAFYAEYQRTEFPQGKTWQLENLGDTEAPARLRDFEQAMAGRVGSVVGDAQTQIDAAMAQLERDNGWRSDPSVKPELVDHKWMASIRELTAKAVSASGAGSPEAQRLQQKFDALVARDQTNREIRRERTFMTADQYSGEDLAQLKDKATSLVKSDSREGGEPLRCTLISKAWREETVEEWTDTSRTTWRIRTTRHLTAQVAARTADGVRLITVALAQDRQADGGWGPLYGNLHQYSDPMLEENVFKDGP